MKEFIILLLKGILIGIGKIIPGVSGAMIAISLGIYEQGLEIVSNIFKNLIKNLKFIISLGSGFIIGILLFSKIIVNLLNNYYLPTILLFIGLIIGGINNLKNNVNLSKKTNLIYFIFTLLIILGLSVLKQDNTSNYSFYMLIIMGIVEAISMIVPGLSGTALLMMFGYYEMIITSFSILDIKILIPFVIGIIIGTIMISKLVTYLFKNYKEKTNVVIYSLSISSIITLLLQTFNNSYNIKEIIISLILLVIGYNITKIIEK